MKHQNSIRSRQQHRWHRGLLRALLACGTISAMGSEEVGQKLIANDQATVWWASSGWKIRPDTPLPQARAERASVQAARNEAEAVQIIVTPHTELTALTVHVSDFCGPQGAAIPADAVDILRVAYVNVVEPTDKSSATGLWPDPLPPLVAPLDLPAGRHQPFWLRIHVPRQAPAGSYTGRVTFTAAQFHAEVPLAVEVYDFTLPDQMTCQTAFGFSPSTVFTYHGVKSNADRHALLAKYFASFATHHISPYDPAPFDPLRVKWPKVKVPPSKWADWSGAHIVTNEAAHGRGSLVVFDDRRDANVAVTYRPKITIPPGGLRLSFYYRTALPDQEAQVSLNHYDANGKWIYGGNKDIVVQGTGRWEQHVELLTNPPPGAVSMMLNLYATRWTEAGEKTGLTWFDDVSLRPAAGGPELLHNGDFEPPEFSDSGATAEQLKVGFDFTAWDRAVAQAFNTYHFNTLQIPVEGLGSGTFEGHNVPQLCGFREGSREYKLILASYLEGLNQHIRERGWLDKAFVYWFDEPDAHQYEFVRDGCRKLKEFAPDLRRMMTVEPDPAMFGGPDLWCPTSLNYRHEQAEARRKAGEHFWWYVCCQPKAPYATEFIDHPGTEMRLWLWQTFQRQIEGILIWETVWWTSPTAYDDKRHPQNPWEDPMSWVSGDAALKKKQGWGNGDGRFLYPPEAAAHAHPAAPVLEAPVDSIRWEMLRDGIEDYEYLVMLQKALAKHTKLPREKRRAYEALLVVPPEISQSMTEFTHNPTLIEQRRDAIARALAELNHE